MSENIVPQGDRTLQLRFEYAGMNFDLRALTLDDNVGKLREVIPSLCMVDDWTKIQIKTLQPTKLIDLSDENKPLSEVFRQLRERIVVEDAPSSSLKDNGQSTATSSTPTAKHLKTEQTQLGGQSSASINTNRNSSSPPKTAYDFPQYREADFQQDPVEANSDAGNQSQALTMRGLTNDQSDYPVCSSTGYLLRHPVPSNNSCLFISVHFCLTNGEVVDQIGKSMRKIIAETVSSDKEHFDEAFLGKPNDEYCAWILDDNNWGGAIELSILCKYYNTEIVAIDVKNTILNRFGEDSHYPRRMLLLYDGLHYDPIKFQPLNDDHPVQTLFSSDNIEVLNLAVELAKEAKQSHQYTDLKTMTMRCATCNAQLDAKTVREHAKKTGHQDFIE